MLLLDTDVLIDYLRDRRQAVRYFEALTESLAVSVVTVAELFAGIRNDAEAAALDAFLGTLTVIEVDSAIARQAGIFRREYLRSHLVEIPDALIAATSVLRGVQLVTLNRRHYPMLTRLTVPYRKQV